MKIGADPSHFVPLSPEPPPLRVYRDRRRPSMVLLPVMPSSPAP